MEVFDLAGRTKLPRWPHVARGPQVGKHWSKSLAGGLEFLSIINILKRYFFPHKSGIPVFKKKKKKKKREKKKEFILLGISHGWSKFSQF